jgi:hypothetical protein
MVMALVGMIMMSLMNTSLVPLLDEEDDIDRFENANGIEDEDGDEPPFLTTLGSGPKSITFEGDKGGKEDKTDKPEKKTDTIADAVEPWSAPDVAV